MSTLTNRLFPMADALGMKLTMVTHCEFGGQLDIVLDRWFEGLKKPATVKIGKSHYDHSSGNSWAVLQIMGNLSMLVLCDNGKNRLFAYVVKEDCVDQALLAQMIRKDAWSRRDLLNALDKALVAVYTRSTYSGGSGWTKLDNGVAEVRLYNELRIAGFGSSDADALSKRVASGELTREAALKCSISSGVGQNLRGKVNPKAEIKEIAQLLGLPSSNEGNA